MKRPNARIDRAFGQALAAGIRAATVTPGHVLLEGGPMADWLVKPDAPALRADWSPDGYYAVAGDRATWKPREEL